MSDRNFFSELQRRNVYRVAVAYGVVAWLLIQAASILLPTFEAPPWAMKAVVGMITLGFPAALVLAWAFELTPEGIKRADDVLPNESNTPRTGRKLIGITTIVAVIAVGLFIFQHLRGKPAANSAPGKTGASVAAPAPPIAEKSIAVLPFENLSSDKDNAYFADGIQDEILTRLSKIAALKVISRTSTLKYKSAPDNLREIGKQLGVAHLLEGSVQKIANAVRINVQLIRAATDEHIWAESYTRQLDDVFAVEGEVAGTIAEQLNAKLTGAEEKAITEKPTQNVAAYDAYLRALSIEYNQFSYSNYQKAAASYAEAVQLDPTFAVAWARLGVIRSFLYFTGIDPNTNSAAAVKEATDRAYALQPDSAETWVALGAYRYRVLRDFDAALQAYAEGLKRLPNGAHVFRNMAYVERRLGRWTEAEAHYKKAKELDPRDFNLLVSMGSEFLNYLRRFGEAQAALDRALEISPNDQDAIANKASVFQSEGRLDEAAKELARIPADSTDDFVVISRITQATFERRFDAAIALIDPMVTAPKAGESLNAVTKSFLTQLGYCQEWAGRPEEARQTFARAVQAIKPSPDFVVVAESVGLPYSLALAYAGLGDKEKALEQARRAVSDYATDAIGRPGAETTLAQIQARFGDLDSAIAALPHLLEVPAGITPADLRLNPLWDPLRKDPRFQKFCEENRQ